METEAPPASPEAPRELDGLKEFWNGVLVHAAADDEVLNRRLLVLWRSTPYSLSSNTRTALPSRNSAAVSRSSSRSSSPSSARAGEIIG